MKDQHLTSDRPAAAEKQPWQAPTIEELDFSATEASYGIPGSTDFAIYAN